MRKGWGWVGAWALVCACTRGTGDASPEVPSPPEAVQEPGQPTPEPPAPEQPTPEQPTPEPEPPEVTADDCGEGPRQLLMKGETGTLGGASPSARVVVTYESSSARVHDTASGRITTVQGGLLGFTRDERRALFWKPQQDAMVGTVLEVEVSTGTVRAPFGAALLSKGALGSDAEAWWIRALDGRVWLYDRNTAESWSVEASPPSGYPPAYNASARRLLMPDVNGAVLIDLTSRQAWRTPPNKAAFLQPDGSAVLYVDGQNDVWGWTPQAAPVLLGHVPDFTYASWSGRWSSGEVLFLSPGLGATLWNPRTNTVRSAGSDVVAGGISSSGARLALVHRLSEEVYSVTVRELPTGTERTLWRGSGLPRVRLAPSGTWLSISVPGVNEDGSPGAIFHPTHIWNLGSGRELALNPPAEVRTEYGPSVTFHEELRLIELGTEEEGLALYSMEDGSRRYLTTRVVVPGEGLYSYWGPGGVFYGLQNAYLRPGELFAWDVRTGQETELGSGTESVCFLGERNLFLRGLNGSDTGKPVTLALWTPHTSAVEPLSYKALAPVCVPQHPQVVFLENGKSPGLPAHGDLIFADVERHCRRRLSTNVEGFLVRDGSVVYQAAGEVWRVDYPKP